MAKVFPQTINPKAKPTGKYAIFKPFSQLTEDDEPEIFCIFAKPDVIAALHTLASFDNNRIDNVIVPFGSGCEQTFKFAFSEALTGRNKIKKVAFQVIDSDSFLTYIWRGIYKHELINTKHNG